MLENELVIYIQENLNIVVGIIILLITIIGVVMAMTKKAIFYSNFNDLGISCGAIAFPAVILIIGVTFFPGNLIPISYIAGSIFLGMGLLVFIRTIKSNSGGIKIIIIFIAKVVMSFLFIFYIFSAFAGKNRSKRGVGMFVTLVISPVLLLLVKDKEGFFRLSASGRPSIHTNEE